MIFEPESGLHAWISAFDTRPQNPEELFRSMVEKYPGVSVQLVDLDMVPGQRYLKLATVNAVKSFHSEQPIAKTLAMELLLYLSAEKQIVRALKRIGITGETHRVAALAVGANSDRVLAAANFLATTLGKPTDELLQEWSGQRIANVRSSFDIGEAELDAIVQENEPEHMAVERLAIERSAMLAGKK